MVRFVCTSYFRMMVVSPSALRRFIHYNLLSITVGFFTTQRPLEEHPSCVLVECFFLEGMEGAGNDGDRQTGR